jgi:peptidyl-prolyl isomerase D
MSACYLKLNQWEKAIDSAEKVLTLDPNHSKAMFRKGQALFGLNSLDKALEILRAAAKLAPQDLGIRQELQKVKERCTELERKSKLELMENLSKST